MSVDSADKSTFTVADIKALRWLAITLGVIGCAMIILAKNSAEQVVAIILVVSMMALSTFAIYLLRHLRARK